MVEEVVEALCECGHSRTAHCYLPNGDCNGRGCGCERYRPMSNQQQAVREYVEKLGLPKDLARELESTIHGIVDEAREKFKSTDG